MIPDSGKGRSLALRRPSARVRPSTARARPTGALSPAGEKKEEGEYHHQKSPNRPTDRPTDRPTPRYLTHSKFNRRGRQRAAARQTDRQKRSSCDQRFPPNKVRLEKSQLGSGGWAGGNCRAGRPTERQKKEEEERTTERASERAAVVCLHFRRTNCLTWI